MVVKVAEELAKIPKPEAASFTERRKLYIVPLMFLNTEAPAEYTKKFDRYWEEVREHIGNLEAKLGRVNRIYHESIAMGGDGGLKILDKLNPSSSQIAREKCLNGAKFEATEDAGLVGESLDWERCLLLGFISEKVARTVSEFYVEASRKRYEHIGTTIDKTLLKSEAGILFIQERHGVQFPQDIEVFSVAPRALDEIHRWLRDRAAAPEDKEQEKKSPDESAS